MKSEGNVMTHTSTAICQISYILHCAVGNTVLNSCDGECGLSIEVPSTERFHCERSTALGATSNKQGGHDFAFRELVMLTVRRAGRMMSLPVESLRMRRSWHRYIFVTPQGNGLILPCLDLLPPRMLNVVCSIV